MEYEKKKIETMRNFNFYYINIIKNFYKNIVNYDFSLNEYRILNEISSLRDCTSKKISKNLHLESNFVNRTLRKFQKDNLIKKKLSLLDKRLYYFDLTKEGKNKLKIFNEMSDKKTEEIFSDLDIYDRERLVKDMSSIKMILNVNDKINLENIFIRDTLIYGDISYLIYIYSLIYIQKYNFPLSFEANIVNSFSNFFKTYDEKSDKIWIVEYNNEIIGFSCIMVNDYKEAELRWFILHPNYRSKELEKLLLTKTLEFCYKKKFEKIFTYVSDDLKNEIKFYENIGFKKTEDFKNNPLRKNIKMIKLEMEI